MTPTDKKITEPKEILKDFLFYLLLTLVIASTGGLPFSIPILATYEKITGNEIYSYQYNKHILIKKDKEERDRLMVKSEIPTVKRWLEILNQKGIKVIEIPTEDTTKKRRFRIEGEDIVNYFELMNNKIISFPLTSEFLNQEELLITIG